MNFCHSVCKKIKTTIVCPHSQIPSLTTVRSTNVAAENLYWGLARCSHTANFTVTLSLYVSHIHNVHLQWFFTLSLYVSHIQNVHLQWCFTLSLYVSHIQNVLLCHIKLYVSHIQNALLCHIKFVYLSHTKCTPPVMFGLYVCTVGGLR